MMVIRNGCVCDPASKREEICDLIVKDGRICRIGTATEEEIQAADNVMNATGCIVAPGLVDVHVHFRDPGFTYKEDIMTGAQAALKGGFTSVVLMANTKPTVDNVDTLSYVLNKGKETGLHIYSCAAVSKGLGGKELTDMEALYGAGAAGFTDDGIPLMDTALLVECFRKAAKLQVPVSLHEEDPSLIQNNGINHGRVSDRLGIGGSDREAEISLVKRDLQLALETGVALNIQHISAKESVELVREARKQPGNHIHAEATPHHFTLTDQAVLEHGTLAKMNPPLREEEDRQAIIAGLQDGTIDIIATDHAPHSEEEKAKPLTEAPSGIIGLETALPLGITSLVKTGYLTMMELIQHMSTAPAELYHLDAGRIAVGQKADLVIFDPNQTWKVEQFASKASNSPFKGVELSGVVQYTIVEGKVEAAFLDKEGKTL